MKCDFCSQPSIDWIYPCEDFVFDETVGSRGAWNACMRCHGFINCNDYHGLATRVVECLMEAGDISIEHANTFYAYMIRLHDMFRRCRTGKAERYVSN